jgi:hypothetical protein
MVRLSVPEAVPPGPVAVSETAKGPSAAGTPEIKPVFEFTVNPGGKLVAVKLVGWLLALI